MSVPTKEEISVVMKGFEDFYNDNIKSQQELDVKTFLDFTEPKFVEAGYREKIYPALRNTTEGNILILTDLGVGDFIVTTGAIREVRRIYPGAHITLVCYTQPSNFAEVCPYVDELILYDTFDDIVPSQKSSSDILNTDVIKFYKWNMRITPKLLERRFDVGFIFAWHGNMELLMYMSGARIRVSSMYWKNFNDPERIKKTALFDYFKFLATHWAPYDDFHCHTVDKNFALLETLLHTSISNRKLEIWYTPYDVSIAKSHLENIADPVYALNMGGSSKEKHYPPEKYAKFLEMIIKEEPTATFVILGGGNEDLKSAEIIKRTAPELYEKNIIDLTNKLTFRQSAALLSFCKMYIGNDTGTMHVAATVGCPVLEPNCFAADFKMRNIDAPIRWAPYDVPSVIIQPKHALAECKNKPHSGHGCKAEIPHCIKQIELETLLRGFHLLKLCVKAKNNKPVYIS